MTAEVVVMNREAIALAADSVMTVGNGPKTINTANKVFMLSSKHSVGILLYNSATFMLVPWELIIKSYRDYLNTSKKKFPTLELYSAEFIEYLEKTGSKFVSRRQQEAMFMSFSVNEYKIIVREIWNEIRKIVYDKAKISSEQIEDCVINVINNNLGKWEKNEDLFSDERTIELRKKIRKEFNKELKEAVRGIFENLPISENLVNKLIRIAVNIFTKKRVLSIYTGIVFAGYGQEDYFPCCHEIKIIGFLCGYLLYMDSEPEKIGFEDNEHTATATIIPFAQDDVVENILSGRHPIYRKEIVKILEKEFDQKKANDVIKTVDGKISENYTHPIIQTINILPKDELASVAETLVNLTSFMRKVSSNFETVGGPIDVAVISKKDGFIWIKRKHYFKIENNIHFRDWRRE